MNPGKKHANHGKNGKSGLPDDHTSHNSQNTPKDTLWPLRGEYRTLHSFQKAEVIYDITFRFTHKFLNRGDRTIDQMIQAARSESPKAPASALRWMKPKSPNRSSSRKWRCEPGAN